MLLKKKNLAPQVMFSQLKQGIYKVNLGHHLMPNKEWKTLKKPIKTEHINKYTKISLKELLLAKFGQKNQNTINECKTLNKNQCDYVFYFNGGREKFHVQCGRISLFRPILLQIIKLDKIQTTTILRHRNMNRNRFWRAIIYILGKKNGRVSFQIYCVQPDGRPQSMATQRNCNSNKGYFYLLQHHRKLSKQLSTLESEGEMRERGSHTGSQRSYV